MNLHHLNVRTRLTLWHVATMGLLLTMFALGVFGFVRESLFTQIDSRLQEGLEVIAATVRSDLGELSEIERHTHVLAFRVLEDDWPLYASGGWIAGDLDSAGQPPNNGRWVFESPRGGTYQIKEERLMVDGKSLRISTAVQCEQTYRSVDRLGLALMAGVPMSMVLILGSGYFLAGRVLRPVQLLTARARAISAENLSDRLVVPNPHDELGQLTAVLNDAFMRLQESFERLKRFTHDAAHELRTPLAVLRSVGEVGLQRPSDIDGYRDVIGSMLEEVDRLGRLVDGLLTLARAESGRFNATRKQERLSELCAEVVDCLRVLAEEKGQSLTLDSATDVMAMIDRDTLRLALINLVANAIRFTPDGGRIQVRAGARDHDGAIIEVQDNGPGIAPAHQPRVFERFYRIDTSRAQQSGGSGLGLAIARWAVEANGGTIELESEPGRGSLFRILLPAS